MHLLERIFSIWLKFYRNVLKKVQLTTQIANFIGPTWVQPGSCRPQMGPMSAPWTLLSGNKSAFCKQWLEAEQAIVTKMHDTTEYRYSIKKNGNLTCDMHHSFVYILNYDSNNSVKEKMIYFTCMKFFSWHKIGILKYIFTSHSLLSH